MLIKRISLNFRWLFFLTEFLGRKSCFPLENLVYITTYDAMLRETLVYLWCNICLLGSMVLYLHAGEGVAASCILNITTAAAATTLPSNLNKMQLAAAATTLPANLNN